MKRKIRKLIKHTVKHQQKMREKREWQHDLDVHINRQDENQMRR